MIQRSTPLAMAALLLCSSGCVTRPRKAQAPEPFVFRSLDLRQQNADGQPAWEITSPEARYDLSTKVAEARNLRGTVFRSGRPHIRVSASRAQVLDDGQRLVLQGAVLITLLSANPVQISGERATWQPRKNLMQIDRRPMASDHLTRIRARTALYRLHDDRVELRGGTELERWQAPRPAKGPGRTAPLRLSTNSLDWRPEQGPLLAPGAVLGQRWSHGGSQPDVRLTASGLVGNLRLGFVDLLAPVRLRSLVDSGWLDAGRTRWAIEQQMLASDQPFRGGIHQLAGKGQALRIHIGNSTVQVPKGCELNQPGEQLRASRCLWYWTTGRVLAEGGVELKRQAYRQITKADQLNGQIGPNGSVVFTAPGSRVQSQFTLPSGSKAQLRQPASPPVTF